MTRNVFAFWLEMNLFLYSRYQSKLGNVKTLPLGVLQDYLDGLEMLQDLDCLILGLQDMDPIAGFRTSKG